MGAIVRSILTASLLIAAFSIASADDGEKIENLGDSLEDKLLEDLGEDFLKDLPGKKNDSKKPGTKEPEPAKPSPDAQNPEQSTGEENPLARIGQDMRKAEGLIAGGDSSRSTQKLQDKIVTDLDKLIEEIRKRKQKQQTSSSGASGSQRSKVRQPGKPSETTKRSEKPARDSSDRVGRKEVRKSDMAAMQSLLKDLWGHLPERQREQMLQSSVEEFLPKYETMIRKYFLRLAEEASNTP